MRPGLIPAWLRLTAALFVFDAAMLPQTVVRAAEVDSPDSAPQVELTKSELGAAAAAATALDLASQLPQIDPAPVIFEAPPEVRRGDTIASTLPSPDTSAREMPGIEMLARDDQPAGAAVDTASADITGGIEKTASVSAARQDEPAETEAEPVARALVTIAPGNTVTASVSSLPGRPAVSVPQEPAKPLELQSEQPATARASTAGGAVYGPELPDAALARGILSKLAPAKGPIDQPIAEFYAGRANRSLWIADGALTLSARSALQPLEKAAEHGLKPEAYAVRVSVETLESQADTELSLTRAMVRYARDARGARINPRRISALITAEPTIPDVAGILDTVAKADAAGTALLAFQPQQPGYIALKEKLADLRAVEPADRQAKDMRKEAELVANMERWRWLPRDLGSTYIIVNVPDFELRVMREGKIIHQTKVIVGKPQTPTPIFSHAMEYLIVNPYWNIPPSIALKEMLPQLQRDPYALRNKGFEIVRGGREIDPASIDWSHGVHNIRIRQPPGERNALGFIKFMFPNDHAVYLHDTPSRGLFSSTMRAFSHGCVRVFEPFGLAEILLADQSGVTARQLRGMIGKGERTIPLQTRIPVHIAYFTDFVDEAGTLQTRADIYGHSAKVRAALGYQN